MNKFLPVAISVFVTTVAFGLIISYQCVTAGEFYFNGDHYTCAKKDAP